MISNCPGSSRFKSPEPENIRCSSCNAEVEIWSDEAKATCPNCRAEVLRKEGASCLDWCRYAKMCVGDKLYDKYMQNKAVTIKQKLMEVLKAHFKDNNKRITHAKNVVDFAEELIEKENGDWHIIIPAAILHDMDERGSSDRARKILLGMGLKKEDMDEICEIILYHHSPGKLQGKNFKILYDADNLVNFKDRGKSGDNKELEKIIDGTFLTESGRELAKKVYLQERP